MDQSSIAVSIVIPACNEANRIARTLGDYHRFLSSSNISFEILVVLNDCRDNTLLIVQELASRYFEIKYKYFPEAIGKGGAILEGFKLAQGDLMAYVDADGSTSAKELYRLMQNIGDCDGIIGSRWLKGSNIVVPQPLARRVASRGFNFLVRLILGLHYKDTQCGGKVFRRGLIESIIPGPRITNFAFDACMLYEIKKRHFRIREFPITWSDDRDTTLVLRKAIPEMFMAILKTRLRDSYFGRFMK